MDKIIEKKEYYSSIKNDFNKEDKLMSNYSMDISGDIGLADYSNIFDYLKIIDRDDNFVIKINKNNKDDIGLINSMLQENKFNIKYTKYDEKGNYYINANKSY